MSLNPALAEVLSHPAVWRGGECASSPAGVASGFDDLDAVLPGGGWPRTALTEFLLEREGIGELRLVLPALSQLQAEGSLIVWIAPPYQPYAPALVAAGIDLTRLVVVRGVDERDALWACEQALRAPECGAAFAWTTTRDERMLRRLQVAAREGRTWGVLWRRPGQPASASTAPLRLALAPHAGRLSVRILKRRGVDLPQPILLDLAHLPSAPLYPPTEARGLGTVNREPQDAVELPFPAIASDRRLRAQHGR